MPRGFRGIQVSLRSGPGPGDEALHLLFIYGPRGTSLPDVDAWDRVVNMGNSWDINGWLMVDLPL